MPEPIYIEVRTTDRAEINRHCMACEAEERPMMLIKIGRKYATLEWDCITLDPSNELHVRGPRCSLLTRGMYDRFCSLAKSAPGRPMFDGNAFYGTITKLLPETARQLAREYFETLRLGGPAHAASVH